MVSLVYKRKDEKKMCCFWKYDHPHQNPFGWCFHGGEHQDTSLIFSKWHPGSWELKPWPKWYLGSGLETPAESGPSQTFFTCCGMLLVALDGRRDHREIVSEKWTPLWRHLCRHHRVDMGATRDGGNLGELVETVWLLHPIRQHWWAQFWRVLGWELKSFMGQYWWMLSMSEFNASYIGQFSAAIVKCLKPGTL